MAKTVFPPKGFTFCVAEKKTFGYTLKLAKEKLRINARPKDRYLLAGMPCVSMGPDKQNMVLNAIDSNGDERVFSKQRFRFIFS